MPRVDHQLAVKKYRRSAAGQDPEIFPEDIRPPAVLMKTMDFLIYQILKKDNVEYLEIYNFIRDRGRAIRKDFKVQNQMKGQECVSCLERLTRFLIHSDFMLSDVPESKYSWKQNRHQLIDTLTTLMEAYDEDSHNSIKYSSEPEFRSYYILLMLDDCTPIDKYQSWGPEIRRNNLVLECLSIHQLYQNRLFELLFRSLGKGKLKYLHLCILHSLIGSLRFEAFKSMFNALSSRERQIKLETVENMLLFNDAQDAIGFCETFGAQLISTPEGQFVKYDSKEWPSAPKFVVHKSNFVLAKRPEGTVVDIIEASAAAKENVPSLTGFAFIKTPSVEMVPAVTQQSFVAKVTEPVFDRRAEEEAASKKREQEENLKMQKRQHILMESIPLATGDIIAELVRESLGQQVAELMENRKFIGSVSKQVANEFVSEVVHGILTAEFAHLMEQMKIRKQIIHSIDSEILHEAVYEVCRQDILELFADNCRYRWLVRNSVSAWKQGYEQIKAQRKAKIDRQRRKVENLRSLPLIFGVSAAPKDSLAFEFKSLGLGEILKPNRSERVPMLSESDITNLLSSYPTYLKLLLYSHSDERSVNYAVQLSIGKWTRTLFRKDDGRSMPVVKSGIKSDTLFSEKRNHAVIVDNLTLQNYFGGSPEQQPNYLCSFPGTNCIVFNCLMSPDMPADELDKMKTSLMKIVLSIPRNSNAILLVFYWTYGLMYSKEYVKQLLDIDEMIKSGLVGDSFTACLGDILQQSSSDIGRSKIAEHLLQISHILTPQPELIDAFEGLRNELLPLFIKHVVKSYSVDSLTFHRASIIVLETFEQMIAIFKRVVTDPKLGHLAWPCGDIPTADILWNSPERLAEINSFLDLCMRQLRFDQDIRNELDLDTALNRILPRDLNELTETSIETWNAFSQRFCQHMNEAFAHQIVCPQSSLKTAAVSWHYELARAAIAIKHIRKRSFDADDIGKSYKTSPSKRTNMSLFF